MLLVPSAISFAIAAAPQSQPPEPPRRAAPSAPAPDADDDDDGRSQRSSPVVITARQLDAARTQIDAGLGSTVYVLNNDTIDDRPSGETGSVADILLQSPGVSQSGETLTVRGSKDVQVRINNVIIPEVIADPADHLSARLAETTRVLTGTLPAQFGFVPAGVITFTTKNGLYLHGGELEVYRGTDGYTEPAVEWAGSVLSTSLFGSASLECDRTSVADLAGNRTRDRRREIGGLVFADHILGPNERVSMIIGGSDERHRFGETSLPAGTQSTTDGFAIGTFQHSVAGFTFQASMFTGSGTDRAKFSERTREQQFIAGTQLDASYVLGTAHVFKAGLLASHSTANGLESGMVPFFGQRDSVGLYAQDEWKLSPALTFNPGLRIDWLRGVHHAGTVEPRASVVWTLAEGLSAHIGYARYATTESLEHERGSASLPDERDDYVGGGIQYRIGVLTLGFDAYRRQVRNLLEEYHPIGSADAQAFEYRCASLRGLELSATYSTHPLSAWSNLSFSRRRGQGLVDNAGIFAADALTASARWVTLPTDRPISASGGVTWRTGKIALSGTVFASSGAVGSATLASPDGARDRAYATIGLSAVYHAGTSKRRRDFRVDVTNLTNARYLLNDGSNPEGGWTQWARGRAMTVGFEQGF
jgi:hypothetical protein